MNISKSFQALQPPLRVIDDTLDCTYQAVPFEGSYACLSRLHSLNQMHPAVVEALVGDFGAKAPRKPMIISE